MALPDLYDGQFVPKNRERIIAWNWLRLVGQFLRRARVIAGDKGTQWGSEYCCILGREGMDCVAYLT